MDKIRIGNRVYPLSWAGVCPGYQLARLRPCDSARLGGPRRQGVAVRLDGQTAGLVNVYPGGWTGRIKRLDLASLSPAAPGTKARTA
jgi:hypothetical protein